MNKAVLTNYVPVIVKYILPSDRKGSRVKLLLSLTGQTRTISYDHTFNSSEEIALDFLSKGGATAIGRACLPKGSEVALLFAFESCKTLAAIFSR